uniref:Uncharacterized protein n=1 Tax=Globodera rostochiensis TaxID=31243 RepID=A0A914GYS9_GLORO
MGLLYAPRPKGKKLFFKDGSLKRLLELTTLFRRARGVQTAKELLKQHGKIPMKEWAAKEQQITAELLEQEEKRHKKSRDKQRQQSKQPTTSFGGGHGPGSNTFDFCSTELVPTEHNAQKTFVWRNNSQRRTDRRAPSKERSDGPPTSDAPAVGNVGTPVR